MTHRKNTVRRGVDRIEDRVDDRHVTIKIDSASWKGFVLGGALACIFALLPTVLVFDQATIRSVVFVGGVLLVLAGVWLRRHFKYFIGRQVRSIIERHN